MGAFEARQLPYQGFWVKTSLPVVGSERSWHQQLRCQQDELQVTVSHPSAPKHQEDEEKKLTKRDRTEHVAEEAGLDDPVTKATTLLRRDVYGLRDPPSPVMGLLNYGVGAGD